MEDPTAEIYAQVGTEQPFITLVDRFYTGVESDSLLRPLYPTDLTQSKAHMVMFLVQRFGGPTRYQAERGHPRLRMRHVHFQIGPAQSDAWLGHMFAAVGEVPELAPFQEILHRYFADSAAFLINHHEVPTVEPT